MNSKLKELVESVKNLIMKNEGGDMPKIELLDINDSPVIFEVGSKEEISVGVNATPDGEFTFSDGLKVVIAEGKVASIETPNQAEEQPVNEGEGNEIEKDALIAELQAQVSTLTATVEEKVAEIEEVASELEEIKNFYSKVNSAKNAERAETVVEESAKVEGFKFSRKK